MCGRRIDTLISERQDEIVIERLTWPEDELIDGQCHFADSIDQGIVQRALEYVWIRGMR